MSKASSQTNQTVYVTVATGGVCSADPEIADMQYGTADTITWLLQTSGWKFDSPDPIQFGTDQDGKAWPGQTPTRDSDTQCSVDDPTSAFPDTGANTYSYTIGVVNTSTGEKHRFDPSIKDEGGR